MNPHNIVRAEQCADFKSQALTVIIEAILSTTQSVGFGVDSAQVANNQTTDTVQDRNTYNMTDTPKISRPFALPPEDEELNSEVCQ